MKKEFPKPNKHDGFSYFSRRRPTQKEETLPKEKKGKKKIRMKRPFQGGLPQ